MNVDGWDTLPEQERQLFESLAAAASTQGEDTVSELADRLAEQAQGRAAEIEAQVEEIKGWWIRLAESDAATTAPKAVEYGASDLAIMGKAMEGLFPNLSANPDAAEREAIGLEMATAFYALGKVARLFGAYQQGRLPGEDSWFDLTVYSLMARRIRQTGRWVG